ncbi:MAG: iron-sulfur cluster assembly scaffold protein [Candidatus Woesearchaeota archaeon]
MYSETTIEHFRNPKHAGEMTDADAVGEEGNMKCGDILKVFIKVKDDVITDMNFLTYGCIAAIASSDMVCEMAIGKTLDEALKITPKDVADKLGVLPAIKYHCSVLGMSALKNAIADYRKKQNL